MVINLFNSIGHTKFGFIICLPDDASIYLFHGIAMIKRSMKKNDSNWKLVSAMITIITKRLKFGGIIKNYQKKIAFKIVVSCKSENDSKTTIMEVVVFLFAQYL